MANVTVYVVTNWQNLPTKTTPVDATNLNHIETGVKNVTDFVNLLNTNNNTYYVLSEVAFTNTLKSKLDGIDENANNYSLPTASTQVLGGVKVDGTTITIENGVITSTTSGVDTLAELTDVNLEDLADGQILKYDAETQKWVNTSEAEVRTQLSLLEDVDIDDTTLEDGQVLKYNGTSEKWENAEDAGGDVLSYEDTLNILGLPPNPVYRLRLATPIMTSNTTPSGTVSASSEFSTTRAAWKAFAQDITINEYNAWCTVNNETVGAWIEYDFGTEQHCIRKIDTYNRSDALGVVTQFKFQGSNDGTTWTDIGECTAENLNAVGLNTYEFNNDNLYSKYRILVQSVKSGTTTVSFTCINMYERYLA